MMNDFKGQVSAFEEKWQTLSWKHRNQSRSFPIAKFGINSLLEFGLRIQELFAKPRFVLKKMERDKHDIPHGCSRLRGSLRLH